MIPVYAGALLAGALGLVAWIFARSYALNVDRPALDPEERFGTAGRRVVAGLVGFGMAGMSAEFSPLGVPTWGAVVLALAGAGAAIWWAGWMTGDEPDEDA
ncbi:MAG: hypothetical protein R6X29_09565 [Acidimicrobiia bacterium]|jgi:hypothetical protein